MWIEEIKNSKGTRYKFCERFINPNTNKIIRVSVVLNSNTTHAKRKATELLQAKFNDKYVNIITEKEKQQSRIDNLTLAQVADEWLEYTSPMVKVDTDVNHRSYVKNIIKATADNLLFTNFSPAMAEKIIHNMYYTRKLSFSYSNGTLNTIKAIFRYAKKAGYIKNISEIEEIKLKRRPATEKEIQKLQNKFLDTNELRECLRQLKDINSRIALAMEFIALTGLRCGELLALRVQDYDKVNSKININGTLVKTARNGEDIQRGTPKNIYSYREVSLNDRAKNIMDSIILENKKLTSWNSKQYKDRGYIFTNSKGNPFNIQYINRQLKKINITDKKISSHIFRHTHISILAGLNVPLKAIMERVGHHDPKTTLSIYTHVTNSMSKELDNKLQAFSI